MKGGNFSAFSNLLSFRRILSPYFRPLLHAIFCMFIVLGVGNVSIKYHAKMTSKKA